MSRTSIADKRDKAATVRRKPKRESLLGVSHASGRHSTGSGLLQRRCSCGSHTTAGGVCKECRRNKETGAGLLHEERGGASSQSIQTFNNGAAGANFSAIPTHTAKSPSRDGARPWPTVGTLDDRSWLSTNPVAELPMQRALLPQVRSTRRDFVQRVPGSGSAIAGAPWLDVKLSKNGDPCACIVFVHNEERNARRIAQMLHEHCSYNLAMVKPDNKDRAAAVPKNGKLDPNSLFPRPVVEQCLGDEAGCRKFIKDNAKTKDAKTIKKIVQMEFFLAIKKASNNFTLPVVALHNNSIGDTKSYRKQKDKKGVSDLPKDIDKTGEDGGKEAVDKLKNQLKEKFGDAAKKKLTETPRQTNIFRWCVHSDLSKCHIGDPHHPDNVIWVTNESDFKKLSQKNLNVVLQKEDDASASSESAGDFSTLFVILKSIISESLAKRLTEILVGINTDVQNIQDVILELGKLAEFGDLLGVDIVKAVFKILDIILEMLRKILLLLGESIVGAGRLASLRYLNIETPKGGWSQQTHDERVGNFNYIMEVLGAVGLDCCDSAADEKIKEGLKKEGK